MAGDAFRKFKDSTSRAITKISVRTSSSIEKSKIRMHVEALDEDLQRMLMGIGEETYILWTQGETSNMLLTEKFEAVKQKKAEIEQLNMELEAVTKRDEEILGIRTELETGKETMTVSCPECGSECAVAAKFCRRCGARLK